MNIIIPEDENYPNVVIDFRDVVYTGEFAKDLNSCVMAMEKRAFVFPGEEPTIQNIKKYLKLNSERAIQKHISEVINVFLEIRSLKSKKFIDFSGEMKIIYIPSEKRKLFVGIPCGEDGVQSIKVQLKKDDGYHYISVDSAGKLPLEKIHLVSSYIDGCGMKEFRANQNVATQN